MIKVFYSPQINELVNLTYIFDGEIITATFNGVSDSFDFTLLPDGLAQKIITELPINPILNVERKEGILYVELLNCIKENATEVEKFPTWIEVI